MPAITVTERVEKKVSYSPCIVCGGTDIVFGDAGESAFNYASGECKNPSCKHEVVFDCDIFPKMETIVKVWNKENNLDSVIKKKELEIAEIEKSTLPKLRRLVAELKKVKSARILATVKKKEIAPLKLKDCKSSTAYADKAISRYELAKDVYLSINKKTGDIV